MTNPILNKVSALNAALSERDEQIERLKKRHLTVMRDLARGDYEIASVSDSGEVICKFPTALYEDCYSDHALDERLIDRIMSDPLENQARSLYKRPEGWEARQRTIWRSRFAQMRRVGIVISEAKP
jgi:hypothetical protein